MAMLEKVIGFIPTRNGEVVREFYEGKLGLRFVDDDKFALVFESGKTMIRIARVGEFTPGSRSWAGRPIGSNRMCAI